MLRVQIEITTRIAPLMDFLFLLPPSFRDRFYLLSPTALPFSIRIHTHIHLYPLYARIYVGMCNGMGRRAPVGAIVAAQITMPDHWRGQTF